MLLYFPIQEAELGWVLTFFCQLRKMIGVREVRDHLVMLRLLVTYMGHSGLESEAMVQPSLSSLLQAVTLENCLPVFICPSLLGGWEKATQNATFHIYSLALHPPEAVPSPAVVYKNCSLCPPVLCRTFQDSHKFHNNCIHTSGLLPSPNLSPWGRLPQSWWPVVTLSLLF